MSHYTVSKFRGVFSRKSRKVFFVAFSKANVKSFSEGIFFSCRIGYILQNSKKMEWFIQKISSGFQQFLPVVKAEDELQDPQIILREECEKSHCQKFFEKLDTCNTRVRSKKKTAETCDEEMIDFISCVDHCVAKTLFTKLK